MLWKSTSVANGLILIILRKGNKAAKFYFFNKCLIPGIIGCVDGTHIKIIKPIEEIQHLYYNRKGYHSINAMVVAVEKFKAARY